MQQIASLDLDLLLVHCRLGHISKKRIEKLQHDGLLNSTDLRAFEKCVSCMSGKMARKPYTHQVERAQRLTWTNKHRCICGPFKITSRRATATCHFQWTTFSVMSFCDYYALETAARILNMVQIEVENGLPYESQGHECPQIACCLYIDVEEHELWGSSVNPLNIKACIVRPCVDKWLNAMNVEMQSMKDNEVWILVELPPNGKTVGSKWLFKKKTDMDGAVHTYKARLVAKGYTQTQGLIRETLLTCCRH
ncbi:retrotransposon protein, putative, ty1-copia subclass [Tanacetum coccineum]